MFTKILLCTHGSAGAQKAEEYVFTHLLPKSPSAKLTVLTIIDKDWSNMSTDDWLNTSTTRTQFKDYVQEQLGREIDEDWQRIKNKYPLAEQAKFIKKHSKISPMVYPYDPTSLGQTRKRSTS